MGRVMIPGSFDPPTNGHINLIERSIKRFEEVIIVIANNIEKNALLTIDERRTVLEEIVENMEGNIRIMVCSILIADFAAENDCNFLVRGVRSESDFRYELELAYINRRLNANLETLLLPADPSSSVIRSSHIRSLWEMGGDMKGLIPVEVLRLLKEKKKHH